jgi:small subunit ribosomal protein S20
MAHSKQALKRVRQSEKRRIANKSRLAHIRTYIKKLEEAIKSGKKDEMQKAFVKTESELAKGVSKGLIKKNTAARKTSRLAKQVKNKSGSKK